MKVADFDFALPEHHIAERPLRQRSRSRLFVLNRRGTAEHRGFSDLPSYLSKGDMLIVNNTKVFPARLTAFKKNGSELEILLVTQRDQHEWEVLSKGSFTGSLWVSEELQVDLYKGSSAYFRYSGDFMDILWRSGSMPIPPYLKRRPDQSDKETYQTVFAKEEGSIAAPTAGLHFTDILLQEITAKGVKLREITLHVGVGTFKPIRAENVDEHTMEDEYFELHETLISEISEVKAAGKKIVTVGTTATRALEGYATGRCTVVSDEGKAKGKTNIFICPGYTFKVVDALVTNFHLPRSTPLMLVSALAGRENILNAYRQAIAAGYRFLSYGDAMLIL